eukprot:jgi/Mesvir1/5315/Mv15408-RA.2
MGIRALERLLPSQLVPAINSVGWRYLGASAIPPTLHFEETTFSGARSEAGSLGKDCVPEQEDVKAGKGRDTVLFLHGLLGTGRNLRQLSNKLGDSMSSRLGRDVTVVAVDLRNHGFPGPHRMEQTASDLLTLCRTNAISWPSIVVGHSLGGKVALEYLRLCHQAKTSAATAQVPRQVWVLDSVPSRMQGEDHTGVTKVLEFLQELPSHMKSRQQLQERAAKRGFSAELGAWLSMNLVQDPDREGWYAWSLNRSGAMEMFQSYREEDYLPFLRTLPPAVRVDIVRAVRSDRWNPENTAAVHQVVADTEMFGGRGEGGMVAFHNLEDAGHWLHTDNPHGLVDLMTRFLS